MSNISKFFSVLASSLLLVACGGGGGGSSDAGVVAGAAVNSSPSVSELDNAKATLTVNVDKMTYQPAMVGNFFVHLSDGRQEVFVDKKNVVKIFYNGSDVGWHSSDVSKGVDLKYDGSANPVLTIAGQPLSPVSGANFSFLTDDRTELSQITDAKWFNIVVGAGMSAERKADGLLYGSSTVVPAPVQTKTLVSINTATGEVDITPVIVGNRLTNLVNSNLTEVVLDASGHVIPGYRIVWNDDGDWYPAHGKVVALQLPKTIIAGAAKPVGTGAGMPYLVRPDGTSIAFNTDLTKTTFSVNGTPVSVGVDGLVHY